MKKWRAGLLIILIFIFCVGAIQTFLKTDALNLKEIAIEGASSATEARIRKILVSKLGEPLWKLNLDGEIVRVKSDSWIESAQISRRWPSTLAIEVTERKPVAVLNDNAGHFKFVDQTGFIIDEAHPARIESYPSLVGHSFENIDLRLRAIELLKALPTEGSVSQKDISDFEFDKDRGFLLRLTKTGMVLNVGKENLPLHIDRARRVVQYLDQHGIDATLVDADYAKKVLVKVRQRR